MFTGRRMANRLVVKLVGIKALGMVIALTIVWLWIDFFALDDFSSLLDRFHVPQKQEILRIFLESAHRSLVWAGLIACAISLSLGFFLIRIVLGPLHQMIDVTAKVAKGDFTSRVQILSDDEIGELGSTFNAMADNLERTEQLRKKMVVDVAHELRAPLTNIRGYLEAMRDGVVEPGSKIVELLHDETLRLGNLSEDLMRLSVADSARLTLEREMVDLHEFLPHSLKLFEAQFAEKRITTETRIASGAELVSADVEQLAQIMQNLLHNAWQYTAREGRVRITVERSNRAVKIVVANTGEPIAHEDLSLIFERFYRVDQSRSREHGGAGVGLAIVKGLVEAHGGYVGAESSAGENRIWFVLPA